MKKYTIHEAGNSKDWSNQNVPIPGSNLAFSGKVFLNELLGLTSCEVSLNSLKPNESQAFCHSHKQNEEVYVFLSGKGEFQVDDDVFPVSTGTTIKVDLAGERCWRNSSSTEELVYFVIQAKAGSLEQFTFEDGNVSERKIAWA